MPQCQFGVRGTVAIGEIVFFEDPKLELSSSFPAVRLQVFHGQREQLPLPFAMKYVFGSFRVRPLQRLGPCAVQIERRDRHRAASFLPMCGRVFVSRETVQRHA